MLGKHLLGIYEKALDAEDDWYQRMAKVKELGFDFMEISIDETDERLSRIYAGDEEIYQIQDAAHKAGVFIQSLCLSVHRRFPFGSADPATRAKAAEIMEKALVFADKLGVRVIQWRDMTYIMSRPRTRAKSVMRRLCSGQLPRRHATRLCWERRSWILN